MNPSASQGDRPASNPGVSLGALRAGSQAIWTRSRHYAEIYFDAKHSMRPVSGKFALIGSGAAGKSMIGRQLGLLMPISVLDVDELFVARFGSIKSFAATHGWKRFFETQGELARSLLLDPTPASASALVIMPASALCHERFVDASAHTLAVAQATTSIVCVLASANPLYGAWLSVTRQLRRGYLFSPIRKAQQYCYQSTFYSHIADYVVVNDTNVIDAAEKIRGFIGRSSSGPNPALGE